VHLSFVALLFHKGVHVTEQVVLLFVIVRSSRGSDTLLGEASDARELFLVDDCQDTQLAFLVHKVTVSFFFKCCSFCRESIC
jgi:hypothetical protein